MVGKQVGYNGTFELRHYAGECQVIVEAQRAYLHPTPRIFKIPVRYLLPSMLSSATSLGWDPTIMCVPSHNGAHPQCDFGVRSRDGSIDVHHTIRFLHGEHANAVQSLGTRVWEAVRADRPNDAPAR